MVGELPRWCRRVIVIRDGNQYEDMEARNPFEVTVASEFPTLSQLFDRWDRISVLFLDVFVGRVLSERTVDEFTERFPSLVVFFDVFQQILFGRFSQDQNRWIVLGEGMNACDKLPPRRGQNSNS